MSFTTVAAAQPQAVNSNDAYGSSSSSNSNSSGAATITNSNHNSPTAAHLANRAALPRHPRKHNSPYGLATASTPNLNSAFSRLATPQGLSRKASHQALTPNSLASIPDDTESYAINTAFNDSDSMLPPPPPPLTPGRHLADGHITIGDTVDVPGHMYGTVRFVGNVDGRKGVFAGVELHPEFAARGKNSGDVDGVSYFTTSRPGAGIFLPLSKAVKRDAAHSGSLPITPMNPPSGLKIGNQNSTNYTPPTPSIPKFSQSVGPGRASSPLGKKPSRPSLARPESPVRRLQMTPKPRPATATPGSKMPPAKYGSPTSKFSQSVRGPAPDPSRRGTKLERDPSVGPRSASALGRRTPSAAGFHDDDAAPIGLGRSGTNGSVGSVSSFQARLQRPPSRANGRASPHRRNASEEMERLRLELQDRDRQLKEQVQLVVEMETSLTELQNFIAKQGSQQNQPPKHRDGEDDKDVAQLRALLREKNEKIAMLTAEFDAHRADFRSTIDTLEMASTETERVYEKKLEEVMQELHDYQERSTDVNAVARQLKQLEELVQELEEGLEDARRGEAEARGEVEFLRGEVERTRSELRREREKTAAATNGIGNTNGSSVSKELEQKEDEIRGLKAIIHSLSRNAVPGLPDGNNDPSKTAAAAGLRGHAATDSTGDRLARERLEREVAELRALLDSKNSREEQMERELEALRKNGSGPALSNNRASAATIVPTTNGADRRSSLRDSGDTVVMAQEQDEQQPQTKGGAHETRSPPRIKTHVRVATLDTMPESDTYSNVTDNSTLYCELCETSGHGILNCTNMFPGGAGENDSAKGLDMTVPAVKTTAALSAPDMAHAPAPLSPVKANSPQEPPHAPADAKMYPNLMESGPVAGKESGVIDAEKWCALCERDGHDSVDCPFEDVAF